MAADSADQTIACKERKGSMMSTDVGVRRFLKCASVRQAETAELGARGKGNRLGAPSDLPL